MKQSKLQKKTLTIPQVSPEPVRQLPAMEMIKTLELQGCMLVMRLNITKAFRKWRKAFIARQKYSMPRDADEPHHFGMYPPFQSVEELMERRYQRKYMMFEALNICIRWMSSLHISTIDTACLISEMYSGDDAYISKRFLMDMFRLNWEISNPLDKNMQLLFERIIAFRMRESPRYFNCKTASKEISMYMDYIDDRVWPHLEKIDINNRRKRKRFFEKYVDVTYYLLKFTQYFLEADPSTELADELLYKLAHLIREEKRRNLPTTLLHQAVKAVYLFGVKLLVQCGAEINTLDSRNNLPIHYINLQWDEINETEKIASFFVRNGSEVDAVSSDGRSVHAILQEKNLVKNNLEKVTLKCLAARAISKYKVRVHQDDCPKNVLHIIKIHGGRIANKN